MRQRNVHGYPLMVPSIGQTVHPGEVVEHDVLIPGFEEFSDDPALKFDEAPDERSLLEARSANEPKGPVPDDTGPLATFAEAASTADGDERPEVMA